MSWLPVRNDPCPSYDRLYTTAMAKLPGATEAQLSVEIANTFQAFCRETGVWRERVTRNIIGGLDTYEVTPARNDADVLFVLSVAVDNKIYTPIAPDAFPDASRTHQAYQVGDDYKTIKLYPAPTADNPKALVVNLSLAPVSTSLDLPGAIISHYHETLLDGVLERMYGHKARPYSDMNSSELHRRKFHAAVTRVRRDVRGGNSNASAPWAFRPIAPGRPKRGGRSYGW